MNKILLLIVTAFPGINKLVLFFLIEKIYDINILGKFSNDYYLIQLFIIFTSIGISSLIMVNIPKIENHIEFLSKSITSVFLLCLLFMPIIYICYNYNYLFSYYNALFLLISMSLNLIIRHYYLSIKKYKIVLQFDLILFLFICILLTLEINFLEVIDKISISYILVFFIFILSIKKINFKILKIEDFKESFHISSVSFLSAGIYLFFIPLINQKLGIEYTALMSIIFTLSSVMVLFPRALSTYYLPDISKNLLNDNLEKIYNKFFLYTVLSLIFLYFISIIILFLISNFIFKELFNREYSNFLYLIFISSILVSQLSLAPSNLIVAAKKSLLLTKIGFYLVIFYLFILFILQILNINNFYFIFIFLFTMVIGNFIRFLILNKYAKNYIQLNKEGKTC